MAWLTYDRAVFITDTEYKARKRMVMIKQHVLSKAEASGLQSPDNILIELKMVACRNQILQ